MADWNPKGAVERMLDDPKLGERKVAFGMPEKSKSVAARYDVMRRNALNPTPVEPALIGETFEDYVRSNANFVFSVPEPTEPGGDKCHATPKPRPDLTLRELSRMQAWDAYFAANIGMNAHPGTTRDKAEPQTYEKLAALADDALALRDLRFPPGD